MAVCEIWDVRGRLDHPIDYAENPEKTANPKYTEADLQAMVDVMEYATNKNKTEQRFFVTGVNCDPTTARDEMMITKAGWNDTSEIVCYHGFQSFKHGEVTPEQAHEVGVKLAERMWGNRFQVIVATHLNTDCLHNHFVVNSVSFADGMHYHDNKANLRLLRQRSDELCREYALSVIEHPSGKKKPYALYQAEKQGRPTRDNVARQAVDEAISKSFTLKDFDRQLAELTSLNQTYSIKVENLEEDGVYTLSCTAKDWANNEYNKFTLDDGQEYENVTFSVNRNGSTFLIDNNTEKMLDKYYVYSVENPVVIKEINTDPIEKYVVKLNGTELEAGEDYITENVNNEGEWNERTYTINKKLFEGEGEYSIVVESTDKAETASYSDIKGLDVSWIVDQTAPVVAVSGLENSGRYKTESQTVTAIPTDDGGKLKSFKAVVADKSGTVKKNNELEGKVLVDLSGEELDTYLGENDGKITFNIPEGLEEQVQIICTDYAVHEDGKTTNEYNEVFSRVTVSANSVIIFYANKPLFYGTIIGIVLTAGGIFLIVWKRKKKKAEGTYKK